MMQSGMLCYRAGSVQVCLREYEITSYLGLVTSDSDSAPTEARVGGGEEGQVTSDV